MSKTEKQKVKIQDIHTHPYFYSKIPQIKEMADYFEMEHYNVLSLSSHLTRFITSNLACMLVKLQSEGRGYAFGSVMYPEIGGLPGKELLAQAERMLSIGFDGIKCLEGKPTSRKRIGVPLDGPEYEPMYKFLEKNDVPVLYHLNDPAEFWDKDKIPDWAVAEDWCYFDGTYPTKREIEEEALNILRKHPKLRVIYAHMFFMSDDYDRAVKCLEEFPNLNYDICPGIEMYTNFLKDKKKWHDFFEKYSTRIFYGTDTVYSTWKDKVEEILSYLGDGKKADTLTGKKEGLGLDDKAIADIMGGNFSRFIVKPPSKVDVPAVIEFAEEMRAITDKYSDAPFYSGQIDGLLYQIKKYL